MEPTAAKALLYFFVAVAATGSASAALDAGAGPDGAGEAAVLPNGDVDVVAALDALRERRSGVLPGAGTADPWALGGGGGGVDDFPDERRPWGGGGKGRGGGEGAGSVGRGAEGGGTGRGGTRARGGGTKNKDFPEELAAAGGRGSGGGRGRQYQQPPSALSPYQMWLQGQILGQQLKPEQQIHLPAQYPRPQPPPDYQQLKGRQFRPRLQKLDAYFGRLGVLSEDCRQRLLCEVARDPARFFPLSFVLEEEAGFTGNYQYLTSQLINSTEGARLLSYMEANFRGQDRARTCDVFRIRCLSTTEDMINFQSLVVWREMIRWLTIHILTRIP